MAPISFKLIVLDQKSIQSIRREAFIVGSNTFSFLSSRSLHFVIFGWEHLQQSKNWVCGGDLCSGYIYSESLKNSLYSSKWNCDIFFANARCSSSHKKHYSQKNHCNDNCNDFSDYNDIIAPLDKLIMLHYIIYRLTFPNLDLCIYQTPQWHLQFLMTWAFLPKFKL